ncbi:MAG TPA: hypothetical protein VLK30_13530 [Candidatus Limnocylindrales bacterium]|nr:hypothetical protein [Candidatus Limnocylindrales bacterium]
MTGAQAEMWRKFTFSKTPPWAFWVGGLLLSAALAERVSGYLPLTRASARKIRIVRWSFAGLILLGFVLWATGFAVASIANGAIFEFLFLAGLGAMFGGVVGTFLGRAAMGPRGKLLDLQPGYFQRLVELTNVHPAFAAAVQQHQQMRAQQTYQPPPPPANWK